MNSFSKAEGYGQAINRPEIQLKNRRYQRGYDTSHLSTSIKNRLKDAERTYPVHRVAEAILTIASIALIAATAIYAMWALSNQPARFAAQAIGHSAIYLIAMLAIARQQRGMEIMVHDASHLTWMRHRPKWNNWLADLFVAAPVMSSIRSYWKSHRVHHGQYGTHVDPCRQRFMDMGLANIDLSTNWRIAVAVVRWLPSYSAAYYREIGSASAAHFLKFVVWHLVVFVAPSAVVISTIANTTPVASIGLALLSWLLFWALPALVALPVIRSIAESEEHDYDAGTTEFETTFTNDGWLHQLLFHPKNDAYHVIHHMFPNIPEARHKAVHRLLMEHDVKYQNALRRRRVLQTS